MKRIWKKPRGLDEMERAILSRAQRNAYMTLVIALTVWSLYESARVYSGHGRLNIIPGFLLGLALAVQTFSQLILTRNAVKDDEDSQETGPLFRIILLTCVLIGLIATVVSAVILMGVPK